MKALKTSLTAITGSVIVLSGAYLSRNLVLSATEMTLLRVLIALILGCFLVALAHAQSLLRDRDSEVLPSQKPPSPDR
ncbi:MAG: hypothetical protein ACRD2D_07210 [Terriglobales bacterium]